MSVGGASGGMERKIGEFGISSTWMVMARARGSRDQGEETGDETTGELWRAMGQTGSRVYPGVLRVGCTACEKSKLYLHSLRIRWRRTQRSVRARIVV